MTAQQFLLKLSRTDLLGAWLMLVLILAGIVAAGYFGSKAIQSSN